VLTEERVQATSPPDLPHPAGAVLAYEPVRDLPAWDSLSAAWQDAALRAGAFYLSHAFLRAWWDCYGTGRLDLGCVRSGERLVALAPLCRRRRRLMGLSARSVENLFNAHLCRSEIALLERDDEALRLVLDALDREPWDVFLLREVPERSRLLELLPEACRARGWALRTRHSLDSPYVSIAGDWESFLATRSKQFRKSVRQKRRRLVEAGSASFECARGPAAIEAVMPEVMQVAERSWTGERGSSIASPRNRAFYERFFREFARSDNLRIWTLRMGGKLAAFEAHVTWGRMAAPLKVAYDPEFAELSVGSVLDAYAMEAAFGGGEFDRYDLLGKDEPYKMRWTDLVERHVEVFVFNRRPASRLFRLLEFGLRPRLGAVKRAAVRMLPKKEAPE
jgi:CelD/BcsL family acetyltransferase involved in cellulose biosynthesis